MEQEYKDVNTSTGIGGGDPNRDYNPTSTDLDQQPAGDTGNYGGGVGDRSQGAGKFGADGTQNLSTGDQYGSSGGYIPANISGDCKFSDKQEKYGFFFLMALQL